MPAILFPSLLLAFFLANFAFVAARLPDDELEALRDIAKTLGKKNWNFNVDPCSGKSDWVSDPIDRYENNVTCSNDNPPRVVSIVLKKQNLPGTLPPELVRLPYLQTIDLSLNYLNGTIPAEWGSMKLVRISLVGNRVTGLIPQEIGNISTLQYFTVEFNQLSGSLPPELGNLPSIEYLHLTSNNFTGELPATFARLTSLKDFRIGDNQFTGKIPTFIQNWTNLEKLVIQASGFMGPIPNISALANLTDLRISDLNGNDQEEFPPLNSFSMLKMKTLMLRSCNIIGELPDYLRQMTSLIILDLSFNKLRGVIPSNFSTLAGVNYIYFTGNLLTGSIPHWILQSEKNIDLSFNNFTEGSQGASSCQEQNVNFFASSLGTNEFGIVSCLRSSKCQKNTYYLHINCGGSEVTINGNTTYEDDRDPAGPSRFFEGGGNWAFSSTGHFLDDDRNMDSFIRINESILSMKDSQLYMNARLSAISLTYYGFCMGDGNYTVNLHFAEIMFGDGKTYSSLGRRIFNIYIQGKLVQKDFNIVDEAGGVGRAIIKKFPAVVTNGTLQIRLYWAAKGTTTIPSRGVYGPLISAISVNPDFTPPVENGGNTSVSVGMVVGIFVGVAFAIILIAGDLWWKCYIRQKNTLEQDLKGLNLQMVSFSLRQIKAATNNFDPANKIGEGGFGPVYKGHLTDGKSIAVKQLSAKSKQGNREFVNEIGIISALQHPYLVKLYGCCIEGNQLLLIYEYMENNSLARALFGPEECQLKLDWPMRQKICIGIAKGLAYLHEESRLKIVHRDIKATNILLDKDLNPKISDFGLAKLNEEDNTHISTRIVGTMGYMAPEYATRGYLTDKADVYSFGIVGLEIVSGRSNTISRTKENSFYLIDWALLLKEKGSLLELVDPRLGSDYNKKEVMKMINVALLCTNPTPAARPIMSSVVSILEGKTAIDELDFKSLGKFYPTLEERASHENQTESMSIESLPLVPSSSASNFYPINLSSCYWQNKD
ncbi:hypothetical protein SLE2022_343490 [Rubroshorea leprosula]